MTYGPADLQAQLNLTDAALRRIDIHRAMLKDWSGRMNLVGPKELARYWERHALDSAQLVQHAPEALSWLDLGAGAGFPGLIVAAILAERPGVRVTLVESIAKKAAFLRAAAEAMAVPARVLHGRVEDVLPKTARTDIVIARAFAPLPVIANHCKAILDRGAVGLFPKGADSETEIAAAAAEGWVFDLDRLPSLSDPSGVILRIRRAARAQRNS
ncbi:MAG: 16S rRNA (guanine(527)-N(7))-methyltransferase RsmG [Caulobacterales bacterium]|jgi:16S rRNA (guanine527-N7)-methyltransferase